MATGDFADLYDMACRWAQRNPNVTADVNEAKRMVNIAAQSAVDTGDPWDFLMAEGQMTLTPGSALYTFSAIATAIGVDEIAEVMALVNDTDGSQPLRALSWADLENLSYSSKDGDAESYPVVWSRFGGATSGDSVAKVRLWPAPDSAYTLGVLVRLGQPEMTGDTDVPLIPLKWRHRVIASQAAANLLMQDSTAFAGAQYDRLMAQHNIAMKEMRDAHATGRAPLLNVENETWSSDLPGSYRSRVSGYG